MRPEGPSVIGKNREGVAAAADLDESLPATRKTASGIRSAAQQFGDVQVGNVALHAAPLSATDR
jgi:hypothetical protein